MHVKNFFILTFHVRSSSRIKLLFMLSNDKMGNIVCRYKTFVGVRLVERHQHFRKSRIFFWPTVIYFYDTISGWNTFCFVIAIFWFVGWARVICTFNLIVIMINCWRCKVIGATFGFTYQKLQKIIV